MLFINEWKRAIKIMLHPASNAKKGMGIAGAIKFYYKLSLIPGALAVILVALVSYLTGHVGVYTVIALLTPWILAPIGLLIDAVWIHLVGKLVGKFKKTYASTLTAYVYAEIPCLIIIWLSSLMVAMHAVGIYYMLLLLLTLPFSIWSIIILVYALSNLQSISRLAALGVWLLAIVLIMVLVFMIAMIVGLALVASGVV